MPSARISSEAPPSPGSGGLPPRRPPRRRWRRVIIIVLVFLLLCAVAAVFAARPLGRWYIKAKLLPRVAKILRRKVTLGEVVLEKDRLEVRRVVVRGERDGKVPLLRVAVVRSDFDWWAAVKGKLEIREVRVERPRLALRRHADGSDNFSDLLALRGKKLAKRRLAAVGRVSLQRGSLTFRDAKRKASLDARSLAGSIILGGRSKISLGQVVLELPELPAPAPKRIDADGIELLGRLSRRDPRLDEIRVKGAELQVLPRLTLSGIDGVVKPKLAERRVELDLSGSYGGARAKLWAAKGELEPFARRGKLDIRAARFRLERIASFLNKTPVVLPDQTSIDGHLKLAYGEGKLDFSGALAVHRLNLFHPALARTPVLDLSAKVSLEGKASAQRVEVSRFDITSRGVTLKLDGKVDRLGPKPLIVARLVMPRTPCQAILDAIPASLVPKLVGFRLGGRLSADLAAHIDYEKLHKLKLGGKLPIYRCKVKEAPADVSAERLAEPFEHSVEVTPGQPLSFTVGPENPDYVAYEAISKNVVNAFLTTEDGAFFRHKGFIRSQFRAALARNLRRGGFRLGASTISMQMVKNVLLSHEKTLSRKLQELILVWYLEQNLTKERIMEIYLNAIEFGPGIFGVGRAAQHYFGKPASEITALEAAFFATILPSPRRRYVQYCQGKLSERWERYVRRVLKRMHSKGRVSKEDFEAAANEQIVFNRDLTALSERDCKRQIKDKQKAWREAYRRRLEAAVRRAAPHQVDLYVPKDPPPKRRRRK